MQEAVESVKLTHLKLDGTTINFEEFNGKGQHYNFLYWIASQFKDRDIFDIGTHRGASALALSSEISNHIYSFDLEHAYALPQKPNISYQLDDLMSAPGREPWVEKLLGSAFIFLDIDPHEGSREYAFYLWLKEKGYQGFIICDDIWQFKQMRDNFWYHIPASEKVDITHFGHASGTGIIRFTPSDMWPATTVIPDNWTVVTGYFDLTKMSDASASIKARPLGHYLASAKSTMSVEQNLVVYCEPHTVELLRAMRPLRLAERTKYVVMSFEDFPLSKYRSTILENRVKNPYNFDDRNTASYYLLCMARYAMLKQTIAENPFNSTQFAWLNICIERMGLRNVMSLEDVWRCQREKFSTCYIDYQRESLVRNLPEYFKWGRCSMCSGFFTGSATYMKLFCDKIEEAFMKMLELGYGHADEQLFSIVFFDNREIFDVYYGDYQQMVTNYVEPKERTYEPVRLLIQHSFDAGDYAVSLKGCEAVLAAVKKGAHLEEKQMEHLMNIYNICMFRSSNGPSI